MKTINNLNFELFYADNFCQSSKSVDKLIKIAVDTYKNNMVDMNGRTEYYQIKSGSFTIATIKIVNFNIVIE